MRELGYIEGKNLLIEWRSAEGKFERLPGLAADLVKLKVDVIVAEVTTSIHAAQKATTKIPIVMGGASAGSICWYGYGVTDSVAGPLTAMHCLGFLR